MINQSEVIVREVIDGVAIAKKEFWKCLKQSSTKEVKLGEREKTESSGGSAPIHSISV